MSQENRREFLIKLSALMATAMAPVSFTSCQTTERDKHGEILPKRVLGSTGEKITMLGVGGFHFGHMPESECPKVIETAIEYGVRLFDTAESYQDGISEERYGKYLTPKFRDEIFLFSKTTANDAASARKHLEGSLRRLKTDHLDLWKMHNIETPEDVNSRLSQGVLEEMLKAKEEGKVRHIGFSGHRTYKAHNLLLDSQQEYETCLLPVNVADPSYESFILNTFPKLQQQKYGIIAMKTLGCGGLLGAGDVTSPLDPSRLRVIPEKLSVEESLHFAWSLPVSTIISGMSNVEELRKNINAARAFSALNESQRNELISRVAEAASTGEMEWYKLYPLTN